MNAHRPAVPTVPNAADGPYLKHGLWMRQLLSLVNFDVRLEGTEEQNVRERKRNQTVVDCSFTTNPWSTVELSKISQTLCPDLEVLHQASAGDLAAIDLLHVDVTRTQQPGDQNLQVADELTIDLWTARGDDRRTTVRVSSRSLTSC